MKIRPESQIPIWAARPDVFALETVATQKKFGPAVEALRASDSSKGPDSEGSKNAAEGSVTSTKPKVEQDDTPDAQEGAGGTQKDARPHGRTPPGARKR